MLVKCAYNEALHLHEQGLRLGFVMCGRLQTSINSILRRNNHINEHLMNYWKTSVADVAMNPILRTNNLFKPDIKYETYLLSC